MAAILKMFFFCFFYHYSAAYWPILVKFCIEKQFFIESRHWRSTDCVFFVFLMQFGLWRAVDFIGLSSLLLMFEMGFEIIFLITEYFNCTQ